MTLNAQKTVFSSQLDSSSQSNILSFRLKQRSSVDVKLKGSGTTADLIQDFDRDQRLDPGEVIGSMTAGDSSLGNLKLKELKRGQYFVRVSSMSDQDTNFRLVLTADSLALPPAKKSRAVPEGTLSKSNLLSSTKPSQISALTVSSAGSLSNSIPVRHWNASFINRTTRNYADYESYDFSRPKTVLNLGPQGKKGTVIARLRKDYGTGGPAGVQNHHFAMQAWTRVRLKEGKFYRLTSQSDDGTRFMFKHRRSGEVLATVNDNWSNRQVTDPQFVQILRATSKGRFDFYVQYYEQTGKAVVDVMLEEVQLAGKVVSSSVVNLRAQPSTVSNTPIDGLDPGETFTVVRQVKSPNDTNYKDWYEVVTSDGKQGYVAADSGLVQLQGVTSVVPIGDEQMTPPPPPPPGNGGSDPKSATIRLIDPSGTISFRADKTTSSSVIAQLPQGTSVTILEQVKGSTYGNSFDQWYRVKATVNGTVQEGYVASFYVKPAKYEGLFPTSISKDSGAYASQLAEANDPIYYSGDYKSVVQQAVAPYTSWLKPSIVAAIASRESGWGLFLSPRGPNGTGDGGHGRGLMQIDDRYHQAFINSGAWTNPQSNIIYAVDNVLKPNYEYLDRNTNLEGIELLRGALAAYNAGLGNVMDAYEQGLDVDYYTTGKDYSWDILNRAGFFQLNGWA